MVLLALLLLFLFTLVETVLIFWFQKLPSHLVPIFTGVASGFLLSNVLHLFLTGAFNHAIWPMLITFLLLFLIDALIHKLFSSSLSLPLLVTITDFFHNGLDGSMVALAFQKDVPTGWEVTTAIFLHELTQELLDLLAFFLSGFSLLKSLLLNTLANASLFFGLLLFHYPFSARFLTSVLIGALTYLFFRFLKKRFSFPSQTSRFQILIETGTGILLFWLFERILTH